MRRKSRILSFRPLTGALVAAVVAVAVGKATTEAPYAGHCRLLQQVVERSPRPDDALALLMGVALGRTAGVLPDMEKLLNLTEGQLNVQEFAALEVRTCAFGRIGELHSEEAIQFLTKLPRGDNGVDMPISLWAASRIALQNARFHLVPDGQEKRLFLEGILAAPHEGTGGVWIWAIQQLCDRGEALSTGIVERAIRELWHGEHGEKEIAFCHERIQAHTRHPERVKAIGSVLKADGKPVNDRLLRWAINQLAAMRTPAADAELRRFAAEARRLTAGSRTHRLSAVAEEADRVIRNRSGQIP